LQTVIEVVYYCCCFRSSLKSAGPDYGGRRTYAAQPWAPPSLTQCFF